MNRAQPQYTPHIASLQVGLPASLGQKGAEEPMDRPWRSGIYKEPVEGPVWLGEINLDGDGQADLKHHGGPDKALCVYPAAHYPYWSQRLSTELAYGAFGENITAGGQDERGVCIGDVYAVGEAIVQVSQPRSPCWKLARRWRLKALALGVQETGYTGWYLRVLRPGHIAAGQTLALVDRPYPEWSVARVNTLRYSPRPDREAARALAACDALTPGWRERFRRLAEGTTTFDERSRLVGQNAEKG